MKFKEIKLKGAYIIELERHEDNRGFFARVLCKKELKKIGCKKEFKQINTSFTKNKGTIRGLHFQYPPKSEVKILKCIKGEIWDVIVDIRKNSKTYGKWCGLKLTENSQKMIFVPQGFAHGFITLKNNCEVIYFVSEYYSKQNEGIMRWNDSFHKIKWPLKPKILSDKDKLAEDWDISRAIK